MQREIELATVVEKALLKGHWKRIRRDVRAPRIQSFYLAADPLEWLPFEYRLDDELDVLAIEVQSGTYRASPPEVVRSAKKLGLTRPLAFLSPRDTLLYRGIVSLADNDLTQKMPAWSRFGRTDSKQAVDDREPESGWFRAWLARNGQLWAITETHEWLVETDISNFFPSIHLDAALDHVLANTRFDLSLIRLLRHLLRDLAPFSEYRISPVGGLPQENFDSSRIIAHSFLQSVDSEFEVEGTGNRYSRYMDDIVVGVDTELDGLIAISRAQRALERLGLYPNSSKTRIIKREEFALDYMKSENDYLGEVMRDLKDGLPVDTAQFSERMRSHLRMSERPSAWERVLRRYYTLSRTLRDDHLIKYVPQHLGSYPGSARHALDYLSTFRLTAGRVKKIREAVETSGALYEDVHLLAMQYLAISPGNRSAATASAVSNWTRDLIVQSSTEKPRLAASALVALAKFADDDDRDFISNLYASSPRNGSLFRRQLAMTALGLGIANQKEIATLAVESNDARLMVEFISAIADGENRAVNVAAEAMTPRERRDPLMFMTPPRPMLLAGLTLEALGKEAAKRQGKWRKAVERSVGPRDRVGEAWLQL